MQKKPQAAGLAMPKLKPYSNRQNSPESMAWNYWVLNWRLIIRCFMASLNLTNLIRKHPLCRWLSYNVQAVQLHHTTTDSITGNWPLNCQHKRRRLCHKTVRLLLLLCAIQQNGYWCASQNWQKVIISSICNKGIM